MSTPAFLAALLLACLLPAQQAPSFRFLTDPPQGLPPMPLPQDQPPPTAAQFALGQQLFHDPILSLDRTVSCNTCHLQERGFAHPDARPPGVGDRRALRHAPVLWNRGYGTSQRWDGSTPSLEAFVLQPIHDDNEMARPLALALQRLQQDPALQQAFVSAFANGVTEANLAQALATFVRGIVRGDAPYDRFVRGDVASMTPAQRSGLWVFESKGACWRCHPPPLFTDESFHATGVGLQDSALQPGRAAFTKDPADQGRFKTPTLRGVSDSAPYMHDGSIATLEDVVEFYGRGGNAHAQLDPRLKPLTLTAQDKANLVAFLRSL